MKKFIFDYWKSLAVVGCIFYLSFASPSTFDKIPTFTNADKLAHLFMYGGLCAVLVFEYRLAKKTNKTKSVQGYLICILFPIILGGLIEILQPLYFWPRSGSWLDFSFNIGGVLISWVCMHVFEDCITKFFVRNKT